MKKYFIGYVFEHGGIIVGGPEISSNANGKKYWKWLVRCPVCDTQDWKFSNTLTGLKHPCKRCYDKSMRKTDDGPAVKRAFMSLKANAKTRNLGVSITENEFHEIARMPCMYCGANPTEKKGPKTWQEPAMLNGIDRVDNSIGYTLENSVPCCEQCNWAKKDLTLQQWNEWINRLKAHGVLA